MKGKTRDKTGRHPTREKSSFESGLRTTSLAGSNCYANKDISCGVWKDRIDLSVCIARSTRHPEKCSGCPFNP